MTDKEQKAAARAFAEKWLKKEGYEKGETQQFWIDLLHDVFGIDRVTEYIEFEKRITMEIKWPQASEEAEPQAADEAEPAAEDKENP